MPGTPFDASVRLEFEEGELARLRGPTGGLTEADVRLVCNDLITKALEGLNPGTGRPQTPWRSDIDGAGFRLSGHREATWKINQGKLQAPDGAYSDLVTANTLVVNASWTGRLVECWEPYLARIDLTADLPQDWQLAIEGDPSNLGIELVPQGRGYINDFGAATPVLLPGGRRWGLRVRSNVAGNNPSLTLWAEPPVSDVYLRVVTRKVTAPRLNGTPWDLNRMVNVVGERDVDYQLPPSPAQGTQVFVRRGGTGRVTISAPAPDTIDWPTPVMIERHRGVLGFFRLDAGATWGLWA